MSIHMVDIRCFVPTWNTNQQAKQTHLLDISAFIKIYVLYVFKVPYFWKGGMYFRCTYWLYSEDFCTLSLEISSIPSWHRCGQVADNADASQGNRPLTVTPLTKATEWSRVDGSDLAIYNQWKWSISHGKISFVLSVEKGGAFGVFHQPLLPRFPNQKTSIWKPLPTRKKNKKQSFQCYKYGQIIITWSM